MTRAPVTLYSRPGCHLCEVMIEALEPLCRAAGRSLHVLDVDADPASRERYGLRIPVACLGGKELAAWPLRADLVARALRAHDGDEGESGA